MIAKAAAFFGLGVEDNVVAFNRFVDDSFFFVQWRASVKKGGTALGSNGNGGGGSSFS